MGIGNKQQYDCLRYLCVNQVQLVQSASACCGGSVFTAGQWYCAVVACVPGGAGPAGVIVHTTAVQLHKEKSGINTEFTTSGVHM